MGEDYWKRAMERWYIFTHDSPVLSLDPVLADRLMALEGADRDSFYEIFHKGLDQRIEIFIQAQTMYGNLPKPRLVQGQISNLPLRYRTTASLDMTVDVVGGGGILAANEIILDAILPSTMINAAAGRTVGNLIDIEGYATADRKILSASVRFNRQTILKLEPIETRKLTYREIFGDPKKRKFPKTKDEKYDHVPD